MQYAILIHNPIHCEAVQKRLFELGRFWARGGKTTIQCTNAGKLWFDEDLRVGITYSPASYTNDCPVQIVTLDDLYGPPFMKPFSVKVLLNEEHEAIVTKDEIKVGCQTFPISILDKLIEARGKIA